MDFSRPKQRRQSEPALPMINVVFLLLIFFLMSAQITAPPPFEITPPSAADAGQPVPDDLRLHLAADGTLALGAKQAEAVWTDLEQVQEPAKATLLIRADAALDASTLAAHLARLSALGFADIQLATVPR